MATKKKKNQKKDKDQAAEPKASDKKTSEELTEEQLDKVAGGSCAAGAHYKTATIAMRKAGGDPA